MDINNTNLPVIRKEEAIKELEPYDLDTSHHNVFYGTLRNKDKIFMLEVLNSKFNTENNNLQNVMNIKHKNILKVLYIMTKNRYTSYLCFEFSEILLSSYISNASPDLYSRLSLLKQCTELLIYFKKINIRLDKLDSNYIFVESLENPNLKVLYHGNIN
jgi:hypothetical protein